MDNGLKVKNKRKLHKTVMLYSSMGTYMKWLLHSMGTTNRDVIMEDE